MLSWVIAGLDLRFGWSPPAPLGWHLAGLSAMVLGYGCSCGRWPPTPSSPKVRIQTERGHTVATGGPYRVIRHPAISARSRPARHAALLGSPWALLPAGLLGVLFVLRTHLEDSTLLAGLPGYADYAARTRFRLVPGVW
jgi:protein-S-isoprenylcysteine O-methyltransferase Ste14